jgi:hypothetical protein
MEGIKAVLDGANVTDAEKELLIKLQDRLATGNLPTLDEVATSVATGRPSVKRAARHTSRWVARNQIPLTGPAFICSCLKYGATTSFCRLSASAGPRCGEVRRRCRRSDGRAQTPPSRRL